MDAPVITIFVRHSAGCKYAGDEFTKRCQCKKHLRWTMHGKQHRRKTGARSWAAAEEAKRALEAQVTGRAAPQSQAHELLLSEAIDTFTANKKAQGTTPRLLRTYKLHLTRLLTFSESRGLFTAAQALTLDNLVAHRATWATIYESSNSRAVVQMHLKHFLRFCHNAGWIERLPALSTIKIDEPETEPLTDSEYDRLLQHATGRALLTIKLMRWSGLAVRDAATIRRADLSRNAEGVYRIIRERTKTGADLYIPIPSDIAEELLSPLNCWGDADFLLWQRRNEGASEYARAGTIGTEITEAFNAAGIRSKGHMVSHRLRATFAVDLLTKGVPLEHVSKLLGHKSVTTTEKHYAKWVKGRQDRLDALVSATWKS